MNTITMNLVATATISMHRNTVCFHQQPFYRKISLWSNLTRHTYKKPR